MGHSGGHSWGIQWAFRCHTWAFRLLGYPRPWFFTLHCGVNPSGSSLIIILKGETLQSVATRENTVSLSAGRRRRMPFPPLGARQSSKFFQHTASHCARSICSALRPTVLVPVYYSPTPCTLLSCLRVNSKILRMLRPYCRRRRHRHQQRRRHSCRGSHPRCPCRRCPCRRRSRRCRRHSKLSSSLMPS